MNALAKQVGGNHYKHLEIQPMEFCYNTLCNPALFNVVKYMTRKKNPKQDLEKAYHCIELNDDLSWKKATRQGLPHQLAIYDKDTQDYLYEEWKKNEMAVAFFSQFICGNTYLQIFAAVKAYKFAKAKELLRKHINRVHFYNASEG